MARNAPWWQGDPGNLADDYPGTPPIMPDPSRQGQQPGMFGARGGFPDKLAQFLTYLNASQGSPLGIAGLQMMNQTRQTRQQAEARERARLQALEDQRNEWLYRQQWERDNPAPPSPTEFERTLRMAGIDPSSEEARELARQRAMNQANPMTAVDVQQPDGSTMRQWVRPPTSSPPPILNQLPPGAVPIPNDGGAGQGDPRTFRF